MKAPEDAAAQAEVGRIRFAMGHGARPSAAHIAELKVLVTSEALDRPADDFVAKVAGLLGVPLPCGRCMKAGTYVPSAPTRCSICNQARLRWPPGAPLP